MFGFIDVNRGNLNRNGFLVLGLCFGLFLASAAQCESKKKSDLNGYKQKSNSNRGPSNSSGSSDGGGYSNADGSSGGNDGYTAEIKEGIEIVTKALQAMQGQVSGYKELQKEEDWFRRRDYRYYKACRSLFIELDKNLWCPPEDLSDNSSSWKELCYYVSQGNADKVLEVLGLCSKGARLFASTKIAVDDDNDKYKRLSSLLDDCSKILAKQDDSPKNAGGSAERRCKPSLLEFRKAFKSAYSRVDSNRADPCLRWKPENCLDQLIGNLDEMKSGLVKIFGDEFINLDREKLQGFEGNKSYRCCKKLVDFVSNEESNAFRFSMFIEANYDDMIAFAKKLPDYLKPVNQVEYI